MAIFCGCAICSGQGFSDQSFSATPAGSGSKPSFSWDQAAGQIVRDVGQGYLPSTPSPLSMTYAYRETATAPAAPPGATEWIGGLFSNMGGFSRFNAAQIQVMDRAIALVSEVANINFARVGSGTGAAAYSDNAQLLIGNFSTGGSTSAAGWGAYNYHISDNTYYRAGLIWHNANLDYVTAPTDANNGMSLSIHEFMHTIAASHPGNYDVSQPGYSYTNSAVYREDTEQYTVMSYFNETESGANYGSTGASTPLLHDIAALQRLYGANMNTRTGNTIYGFNSNTGLEGFSLENAESRRVFSIWDAGGVDTLDLSGFTNGSLISLVQESFTSAGMRGDGGPMVHNISIARNVVVENAIGGAGADTIIGNSADNVLTGGGGADTLNGSAGNDTATYAGNRVDFDLSRTTNGFQVRDLIDNRNGTDVLEAIEIARFADRSVNFSVSTAAAGVSAAQLKTLLELYVGFFNRIPEAAGVKFWIDQLATNGGNLTSIANQFYEAGVQFSSLTGYSASMTNAEFITKVYANVLGRTGANAPNASEIGYWNDRLVAGTDTKGSMVLTMISDVHRVFTGDPTFGFVASLLTNKSTVANTYAIQMGLSFNTDAENIARGMEMAAAVTPTSTAEAIALIGVTDTI
ncbi:RTX calcium-binding nonapeptide repeat [Rhabdaerophilaceae bacterium]